MNKIVLERMNHTPRMTVPITPVSETHRQKVMMNKKLFNDCGRKVLITDQTNFRDCENPFRDYSLTL